jgi:hypothetical protein
MGLGTLLGSLGWAGIECHHLRGAGGSFEAGDGMLVAVANNVGDVDGSCVAVVSNDVVMLAGVWGHV